MKSAGREPEAETGPTFEIRAAGLRRRQTAALRFGPVVLALGLLALTSARAEAPAAAFDAANRLYEQGKYSEASAAYEKLLQSGRVSAALCFNLGNARFKAGQVGRAISSYRRAQQLAPRDPDLRANLRFARNQVQGPTLAPNRVQSWFGRLTLDEWTLLTAACLWLWLLLLGLWQWRPALKPVLRSYAAALGALLAIACACSAAAFYLERSSPIAVVIVRDTNARQSPFEESPTAFTLHDGAEVRILDEKDDWLQVGAHARRAGWLRRNQVALAPGA